MHRQKKRQGKSFLCLITEDIQQRAQETCREAMGAQQRAQEMRHLSQLARYMRQANRVERALWREQRKTCR
jgi:hypothetical protein